MLFPSSASGRSVDPFCCLISSCHCVEREFLLILHLRYSTSKEFVLIAMPKPVNEESKMERTALIDSCNKNKDMSYFQLNQEIIVHIGVGNLRKSSYRIIENMRKEDHNCKLEGCIGPNIAPAYCQ